MTDTDTDAQNQAPSYDPANEGHLSGVLTEVLKKFLQQTDDHMPAEVIAFDRARNVVQVQPLIYVVKTDGTTMQRAEVAEIPVYQIGGGKVMLNFNLKPGDLGYIKASDRDTSLFNQSGKGSAPNTFRLHSFSDGVFYPACLRDFVIEGEDEANAVFSTTDGTQRVAIWSDRVKITSGGSSLTVTDAEILMDTPLVRFTGQWIADGTRGNGDATFNGTIRTTGDVIANTISLEHHVHANGGGTGNSGTPVP